MSGCRVFFLIAAFAIGELYADCTFSLNEHVPKKVILMSASEKNSILYPNEHNILKVRTGARMKLSCGDKHFNKNFRNSKDLLIRCNKNDIVNANGKRVHFKELECEDFPATVAKLNKSKTCYKNNTRFDINFEFGNTVLNLIHVCFDNREKNSIYSWYDSSMLHMGHQSKVSRPYFVHDDLYDDLPVDNVYRSKNQREVFAKLLKSKELAAKYVKDDGQHSLSRGHLTPKADFVYGPEQAATFHYINAAPQWQSFNGGNWNHIEMSVRNELEKEDKKYLYLFTYIKLILTFTAYRCT